MSKSGRKKVMVGSSHEEPQDTYRELIQGPREVAERQAAEEQQGAPQPSPSPTAGAAQELSLEQIQAVPKTERRPTNFALPKILDLHRRMTYYKVDHDVQIQDQIARATDRWLRDQGY